MRALFLTLALIATPLRAEVQIHGKMCIGICDWPPLDQLLILRHFAPSPHRGLSLGYSTSPDDREGLSLGLPVPKVAFTFHKEQYEAPTEPPTNHAWPEGLCIGQCSDDEAALVPFDDSAGFRSPGDCPLCLDFIPTTRMTFGLALP